METVSCWDLSHSPTQNKFVERLQETRHVVTALEKSCLIHFNFSLTRPYPCLIKFCFSCSPFLKTDTSSSIISLIDFHGLVTSTDPKSGYTCAIDFLTSLYSWTLSPSKSVPLNSHKLLYSLTLVIDVSTISGVQVHFLMILLCDFLFLYDFAVTSLAVILILNDHQNACSQANVLSLRGGRSLAKALTWPFCALLGQEGDSICRVTLLHNLSDSDESVTRPAKVTLPCPMQTRFTGLMEFWPFLSHPGKWVARVPGLLYLHINRP